MTNYKDYLNNGYSDHAINYRDRIEFEVKHNVVKIAMSYSHLTNYDGDVSDRQIELHIKDLCKCDCHKEGHMIRHCISCCDLCCEKYLNEDGEVNLEKLKGLIDE